MVPPIIFGLCRLSLRARIDTTWSLILIQPTCGRASGSAGSRLTIFLQYIHVPLPYGKRLTSHCCTSNGERGPGARPFGLLVSRGVIS